METTDFDRTWHGPPELCPRDFRTQGDKDTWMSVCVENEYDAPLFKPDDVVIDIGANIGAFVMRAWLNGSRRIIGFEPSDHYYKMARVNVGQKEGVELFPQAVWWNNAQVFHDGFQSTMVDQGTPVPSTSLDNVIALKQLRNGKGIRFLKIDCEGAEWKILDTCTKLHQVQEIAGEYHVFKPFYGIPFLAELLERNGFKEMSIIQRSETTGGFHAKR